MTDRISADIRKLENNYDPDHDIAPGVPEVSYTDYQILKIATGLLDRVSSLQAKLNELEMRVAVLKQQQAERDAAEQQPEG